MSSQTPKIVAEKIRLTSLNIIKANLIASDDFIDQPKQLKFFNFGVTNNIAHDLEKNMARFRLFFKIEAADEQDQPLGASIEYGIETHFHIDNFKNFIRYNKGVAQIDDRIGTTLMSIAYSTARGVIFERTRGTFFHGVILPVVDPYSLLHQPST